MLFEICGSRFGSRHDVQENSKMQYLPPQVILLEDLPGLHVKNTECTMH